MNNTKQKIISTLLGIGLLFLPVSVSARTTEKTMTGQIQDFFEGSQLGSFHLCKESGDCLSFLIYYWYPDTSINGKRVGEARLENFMQISVKYHINAQGDRVADIIKTL